MVWQQICAKANRTFIRSPDGSISYGRIAGLITRLCTLFDQEGVCEGGRILIVSSNEAVASAVFLAAFLDGHVPVMLSPDSASERIASICASVEADLLVIDEDLADAFPARNTDGVSMFTIPQETQLEAPDRGLNAAWKSLIRSMKPDSDYLGLDLPVDRREPNLPAADDHTAYILFTSGTTKAPSGVQISRKAVVSQMETLTRLFGYDGDSRIFNATPLAHTDGLAQGLILAAVNGATLLRPGPFSISTLEEWLDSLARFEATHFITNPTVLSLVNRFAAHDDYFDDEGFFGILSSASILRPELWEKLEARFSCSVYNMYGMTETVANATYAGRHSEMGPVGTIGIPVDCEVRLVEVDAGQEGDESSSEGEIQVRGDNVFSGYWKDPERTALTLIGDGWMRTGDLARRRQDGGLEIIGRIKTMINMGGQSVSPEEIDEVLAAHHAVVDVATVGLSDPEFEEIAVSAVVVNKPTCETELTEHCRQRLEHLKIPKRIITVDRIPRGDAGKPKTRELRDLLVPLLAEHVNVSVPAEDSPISPQLVYEMAADVFHVHVETLNSESSPATVEGWDSFNQLSLMIEAESRFGVRIPASQVASIRTLGDLFQTINATG